ncbi:hypothetical protein BJX64DRAFT_291794 [Aspergillus heterothallicus]
MSTTQQCTACTHCGLEICNRKRYLSLSYNFEISANLDWFAAEFDKVASNNICHVRRYVISTNPRRPNYIYVIVDLASAPEGNPADKFRVPRGNVVFKGMAPETLLAAAAWHRTCSEAIEAMKSEAREMKDGGLSPVVKVFAGGVPSLSSQQPNVGAKQ